jgi:hypothetical protein
MQAVTAILDMRGADIFIGGQQVFHAYGDERTERATPGGIWKGRDAKSM